MSVRRRIDENVNNSKNTRLPIAEELSTGRFEKDCLCHISRYLYVVDCIVDISKQLTRPVSIIDIGCGDAFIALSLNRTVMVKGDTLVSRYCGIDIEIQLIDKVKLPRAFPSEIVITDVTTGGLDQFPDKSFDIGICLEMIEHIQPQYVLPLLKEMRRISSTAFISTPNRVDSRPLPVDHIKEWRYEELNGLIAEAGFTIEQEIGIKADLNIVKKIAKKDARLMAQYQFFSSKVDKTFLSLIMGRCMGNKATNILRICS